WGGIYEGARMYRPEVGCWQTLDPWWPTASGYVYASGSPATRTDVLGLSPDPIGGTSCRQRVRYRDIGLDDPWSKAWCRAACFQIADQNNDHSLGPLEKRVYSDCEGACERIRAKGTKRLWCKGIEAAIDHMLRHGAEGYKSINNKKVLEALLA